VSAGAEPTYKDRSAGLLVGGVTLILLGSLSALLIPISVLTALVAGGVSPSPGAPDLRSAASGVVIYGCFAAAFVWLGVGSIRARRWAQKMILVLSWLWLITGVFTLLFSAWVLPSLLAGLGLTADLPGDVLTVVVIVVFIVLCAFSAVPAALVLFYRSPHVIATCAARDPGPSRIADAPSHILSLVLIYVLGAVSVLTMPAYDFVMPFFGMVLSGAAGAIAWTLVLVLLGYLAWATLGRDPRAWRIAVAATIAATAASTICVAVVPLPRLIDRMGLPQDQAMVLEAMAPLGPAGLAVLSVVSWGTLLVYLLYTKRWFDGR